MVNISYMGTKIKHETLALMYMEEHGSTTVRDLYPYMNSPTKVLSNLWKKGLIEKKPCSKTDSDGNTVYFKRYYLRREA